MGSKTIYNFWVNSKPFRTIWIIPLIITGIVILLFVFYGESKKMQCEWEVRDRWECTEPIENN